MLYHKQYGPGLAGYLIIYAARGVRHLLAYYRNQRDRRRARSEGCAEAERAGKEGMN